MPRWSLVRAWFFGCCFAGCQHSLSFSPSLSLLGCSHWFQRSRSKVVVERVLEDRRSLFPQSSSRPVTSRSRRCFFPSSFFPLLLLCIVSAGLNEFVMHSEMWDGPITGVERVTENFGFNMVNRAFLDATSERKKHHTQLFIVRLMPLQI